MDTLGLVGTDNDVPQSSTGMKIEDGAFPVSLRLVTTSAGTTVIPGPATIKGVSSGNLDDSIVRVLGSGCRDAPFMSETGKSRWNEEGEENNFKEHGFGTKMLIKAEKCQ